LLGPPWGSAGERTAAVARSGVAASWAGYGGDPVVATDDLRGVASAPAPASGLGGSTTTPSPDSEAGVRGLRRPVRDLFRPGEGAPMRQRRATTRDSATPTRVGAGSAGESPLARRGGRGCRIPSSSTLKPSRARVGPAIVSHARRRGPVEKLTPGSCESPTTRPAAGSFRPRPLRRRA
jgi:hypothetical protein